MHSWIEILAADNRVIGGAVEDVACRAKRENAEREQAEFDAQCEAARRTEAAAYEAAASARDEPVEWRCKGYINTGCGVALTLPRRVAERRAYCCSACRRRCRRKGGSAGPCAKCGAASGDGAAAVIACLARVLVGLAALVAAM